MTRTHTRRRVLVLAGGAALAGLAGCGSQAAEEGDTPEPTTTDEPTPEPATAEPTATPTPDEAADDLAEIRMITDGKGSYFDPKGLLVAPGSTVRFVNDSGTHAVAAYHPDYGVPLRMPEEATPWKSELFTGAGGTHEVTLDTPGVYDFYCPPHEVLGMVGRLVVGEPQGGPGTTAPSEIPPAAREKLPTTEAILENEVVNGP